MPHDPKEFDFHHVLRPEDLTEEHIKATSSTVVRALAEAAKRTPLALAY
jgi:hypothetical protein